MSREPPEPKTVTVHVPMAFKLRRGRKTIVADVIPSLAMPHRTESALLKALAKAFRWRKQIEEGDFSSITELARAKGVNDSYACRLLRLTLLAPETVGAILDGKQNCDLTLKVVTRPLPLEWQSQSEVLKRLKQ
jgi:hypothetical protein